MLKDPFDLSGLFGPATPSSTFQQGIDRAVALITAFSKAKPGQKIKCESKTDRQVLEACSKLLESRKDKSC